MPSSQNTGEADSYCSLREKIRNKAERSISAFVDHLVNDHSRFVPKDANVHHVTSNTGHFLKLLSQNRPVLLFVYDEESSDTQHRFSLSKLLGACSHSCFTVV